MKYPWGIFSNLWQTSDFLTPQALDKITDTYYNNNEFYYKYNNLDNYGIHHIACNLNQITLGKIIIDEIICTFPNGINFHYNSQWKIINGSEYIINNNKNIYSIECDLSNYSMLLQNKSMIEIGLIIEQNSFQTDEFIPLIYEAINVNDFNDIKPIGIKFPIIKLIPLDLIKNSPNYLPLFRISTINGIFSMAPYQYPIAKINCNDKIGVKIKKFIDDLYLKVIYIHKENKNLNINEKILLNILMEFIFSVQSLLANTLLTPMSLFEYMLNLLGKMEAFMDFNNKVYNFFFKDLLLTFEPMMERINFIFENFYKIGNLAHFQYNNNIYTIVLDNNFKTIIYLDFISDIEKDILIQWIESSIIDNENNLNQNKINKNRGLNREFITSNNYENNQLWVRYSIDLSNFSGEELAIFNPITYENLKINLIQKNNDL